MVRPSQNRVILKLMSLKRWSPESLHILSLPPMLISHKIIMYFTRRFGFRPWVLSYHIKGTPAFLEVPLTT